MQHLSELNGGPSKRSIISIFRLCLLFSPHARHSEFLVKPFSVGGEARTQEMTKNLRLRLWITRAVFADHHGIGRKKALREEGRTRLDFVAGTSSGRKVVLGQWSGRSIAFPPGGPELPIHCIDLCDMPSLVKPSHAERVE